MRKWYIFGAAALALVLVASSPFIWHEISQRRYYHNLTKELMEEEEQGKEIEIKPTATDNYINDFKYTSTVKIGDAGFEPAHLSVKPQTKVIFTGVDTKPHFVKLSPGSPTPKHFDPKVDITMNSMFQVKFETPTTYSFYDRSNPAAGITITVSQ